MKWGTCAPVNGKLIRHGHYSRKKEEAEIQKFLLQLKVMKRVFSNRAGERKGEKFIFGREEQAVQNHLPCISVLSV